MEFTGIHVFVLSIYTNVRKFVDFMDWFCIKIIASIYKLNRKELGKNIFRCLISIIYYSGAPGQIIDSVLDNYNCSFSVIFLLSLLLLY